MRKKSGWKMDCPPAAFEDGWTSGGGENLCNGRRRWVQPTVKDRRTDGEPGEATSTSGKTDALQNKIDII